MCAKVLVETLNKLGDHKDVEQRTRPMGEFKNVDPAKHSCRVHDEVRNFLRPRSRRYEVVSRGQRRLSTLHVPVSY